MDLTYNYNEIEKRLSRINFNILWPSFSKYKFALYNDTSVCLDKKIIDKTNEFIANTSIIYNNEYIAIWKLTENTDLDILTSKIVHEMFHAFQQENKETRFPNEFISVLNYKYFSENLNVKAKENEILISLLDNYSFELYEEFLKLKKYRILNFPFEFDYEAKVEVIEGAAQFVELMVLKQLDIMKYENLLDNLKNNIVNVNNLIPVRIISYDIGALFLLLLNQNNIKLDFSINKESYLEMIIKDCTYSEEIKVEDKTNKLIEKDLIYLDNLIRNGTTNYKNKIVGEFEILGFNVYSARYHQGYLYTEYFLMYKDEKEIILYGNFLVKLNNYIIKEIYTL